MNYLNKFQRTWVSVGVGAVGLGTSIYKGIKANQQDKAAKNEGNNLRRPFEQVPNELIQNRNIREQMATGGLSPAEKQYAGEQRERALGTSASAIEQTGGGPNDLAGLNNIFNDSLKSQSAVDAQGHLQNINFFTDANKDVAAAKTTQWGVNELQPYESKLKEIQDRRIAAQTNENSAVDEGIGSASAIATGVNSYLSTRNPPPKDKINANVGPYKRTFGLQDTGTGGVASPAAGYNVLNPNAAQGVVASNPVPQTADDWPM